MKKANVPERPQDQKQKQHRSLGRTLTYAFTVVLLVVIVIAFVGTPAVSGVATGSRVSFGSYAGREIVASPGNFFTREYQRLAQNLQQQQVEVDEYVFYQLYYTSFQRTVFHLAMLDKAERAGVGVTGEALSRALAQWPEFQVDGRFSSERYNAMAAAARNVLRDYLRDLLIDRQVQADLYGSIAPSELEREFILSMAGPERRFRFVQWDTFDFPDSEVLAYATANARRFRRMDLSVITISSSESDANNIRDRAVRREASFEDLASNHSVDSYGTAGGDMGWVYYHELEPDFEDLSIIDTLFELREGEISPVYRATFGWKIYRVNQGYLEPDFEDPLVLDDVRNYMSVFERGLVEDHLRREAVRFAERAAEAGFAAAAAEMGRVPELTDYFPVNYGNLSYFAAVSAPAAPAFQAIAFREEFLLEAFALEPDRVSQPIVLRDSVFALQLADERETNEDTVELLELYLPYMLQEFAYEELQRVVFESGKLVDNFNASYTRHVLGR